MKQIKLPHEFIPRDYQVPMMTARQLGFKREVYVLHRRAGKDLTAINDTAKAVFERVGIYYYLFPTFAQAKKVIWDGMTGEGRKFTDYFPRNLIKRTNGTEMKIEFINGSILQLIGTDNYDSIKGTNCVGAVFSEYALQDPRAWELVIEPILAENDGWAKFLYTPNGKNHGYELWNYAESSPEWFSMMRNVNQTKRPDGTPVISPEFIQSLRDRNVDEELIQQEYYCSFRMGTAGAYYAKLMEDARQAGRIRRVPFDNTLPVHTAWDIGVNDFCSIIFFQKVWNEYHVINFYENMGEGVQFYAQVMQDMAREFGYYWGNHYAPHDIKARSFAAEGKSSLQVANSLGLHFQPLPKTNLAQGLAAVRSLIPKCWFDEEKCKLLIRHLENYTKAWNNKLKIWMDTPKHDEHSHGSDGFRMFGLAEKSDLIYAPNEFVEVNQDLEYVRKRSNKYSGAF